MKLNYGEIISADFQWIRYFAVHSHTVLPFAFQKMFASSEVLQKQNSEQYQGIQISFPNPSASSYVRYSSKLTFKTIIVPERSKNVALQTSKSVTY